MPSNRLLAVALAVLVLLSGCSMLPGGGSGDDPAQADGPDYHELTFYSNTDGASYNGTLSVTRDGETVHETPLEGDGDGTYLNVTTFDEAGPYTVVVNTSLPETGGGTMHEELAVDGSLGNATVVTMNYQGADATTMSLPRTDAGSLYLDKRIPEPAGSQVRVTHQGETLVDDTFEVDGNSPTEIADLDETGVYQVEATGLNNEWTNQTVVVTESGAKVAVHRGTPPTIAVYASDESVPNEA